MSSGPVTVVGTPALYHRGQNGKKHPFWGDIGFDWLQVTGPCHTTESVLESLWKVVPPVGSDVPREGAGRKGYASGWYFPGGVDLQVGGRGHGRWWLTVQGGGCRLLGFARVLELARACALGASFTRVDVAWDLYGEGLTLVDDIFAACKAGYLRGPRSFQPWPRFDADGKTKVGDGVYLGSSKSGQFVRCYDKGLELGSPIAGQHMRYEAQFRDGHAHEAMSRILELEGADLVSCMLDIVASVADFRIGPRGDGVNVSRLPRCEFWSDLVSDAQFSRLRAPVPDPRLDTWLISLCDQYGSLLVEASRVAGLSTAEAAEKILRRVRVSDGTRKNPILPLLAAFLRD